MSTPIPNNPDSPKTAGLPEDAPPSAADAPNAAAGVSAYSPSTGSPAGPDAAGAPASPPPPDTPDTAAGDQPVLPQPPDTIPVPVATEQTVHASPAEAATSPFPATVAPADMPAQPADGEPVSDSGDRFGLVGDVLHELIDSFTFSGEPSVDAARKARLHTLADGRRPAEPETTADEAAALAAQVSEARQLMDRLKAIVGDR